MYEILYSYFYTLLIFIFTHFCASIKSVRYSYQIFLTKGTLGLESCTIWIVSEAVHCSFSKRSGNGQVIRSQSFSDLHKCGLGLLISRQKGVCELHLDMLVTL